MIYWKLKQNTVMDAVHLLFVWVFERNHINIINLKTDWMKQNHKINLSKTMKDINKFYLTYTSKNVQKAFCLSLSFLGFMKLLRVALNTFWKLAQVGSYLYLFSDPKVQKFKLIKFINAESSLSRITMISRNLTYANDRNLFYQKSSFDFFGI